MPQSFQGLLAIAHHAEGCCAAAGDPSSSIAVTLGIDPDIRPVIAGRLHSLLWPRPGEPRAARSAGLMPPRWPWRSRPKVRSWVSGSSKQARWHPACTSSLQYHPRATLTDPMDDGGGWDEPFTLPRMRRLEASAQGLCLMRVHLSDVGGPGGLDA
jgi:hypothetical protein